jgi:hypothetical protein
MSTISETLKSYIAGFLDGDGCIVFQLIRRRDYIYGYQIRASIIFFQKTVNLKHLKLLKSILKVGSIRNRNDGMSEYSIVGLDAVIRILGMLKPYVLLKKQHIKVAFKISEILKSGKGVKPLVQASKLVDKFGKLNYSKKRTNTSDVLKEYLYKHNLYPRND